MTHEKENYKKTEVNPMDQKPSLILTPHKNTMNKDTKEIKKAQPTPPHSEVKDNDMDKKLHPEEQLYSEKLFDQKNPNRIKEPSKKGHQKVNRV